MSPPLGDLPDYPHLNQSCPLPLKPWLAHAGTAFISEAHRDLHELHWCLYLQGRMLYHLGVLNGSVKH